MDFIFQDNCVVHWSPPKDNGGTEIKKYVIEAMDNTTGNGQWTEVAQSNSGEYSELPQWQNLGWSGSSGQEENLGLQSAAGLSKQKNIWTFLPDSTPIFYVYLHKK